MLATSPCVVLLAALPVGFAVELGGQRTLTLANRAGRPLSVTPLGRARSGPTPRVLPRTLHPFLPLPVRRSADLPLAPGASIRYLYSARLAEPSHLAVREADGSLRLLALPDRAREIEVAPGSPLSAAEAWTAPALAADSPRLRSLLLLSAPLGTLAFLAAWRAAGRPTSPPEKT